jgi:hypothetical protein
VTPVTGGYQLDWSAVIGAAGYHVNIANHPEICFGTWSYVGNVLTYTVTGLATGYNYYFKVRAVEYAGESQPLEDMGPWSDTSGPHTYTG